MNIFRLGTADLAVYYELVVELKRFFREGEGLNAAVDGLFNTDRFQNSLKGSCFGARRSFVEVVVPRPGSRACQAQHTQTSAPGKFYNCGGLENVPVWSGGYMRAPG